MKIRLIWLLISLSVLSVGWPQQVVAQNQILERSLLQRVEQAQQELTRTEQRIGNEREALSEELRQLEQQVSQLREQSAAARRASDERTLGLQRIETRLQEWQEQQNFQQGLVSRFLQGAGMSYAEVNQLSFADKLSAFAEQTQQQVAAARYSWQSRPVLYPDGETLSQPSLRLGPLYLIYAEGEPERSGIARSGDASLRMQTSYNQQQASELGQLYQTGTGTITIDPSLGRATPLHEDRGRLLRHLQRGGMWLIPILLAAFAAFVMALYKAWQLVRLPRIEHFEPGKTAQSYANRYQRAMLEAMHHAATEAEAEDTVFARLQHIKHDLHKGLSVVAVVATIAPLLGLLGTVSGMIKTFDMMAAFGSSDADVVSGGIGEALVTTELGLIVAIPSLILSALLSRRARNYYQSLQNFALSAASGQHAASREASAPC